MTPRFSSAGLILAADDQGDLVRFADIEPALKDSKRLAWLLPVLTGEDDEATNARTAALGRGLVAGKTGIALVDWAMQESPA